MAYSFSKINELLDGEQQKANIFGQQAGAQGQQQQSPGGGGTEVKTSTEGSLSAGGGSGGSTSGEAPKSQAVSQDQSQQASMAALQANKGKTEKPRAFENIYSQLEGVKNQEQAEANKYVQSAKDQAQTYDVSDEDISAATKSGGDSLAKVKEAYNKSYQDTDFANYIPKTNYNVQDVDLLKTAAGQKELLKKGQSPTYTKGMADFDLQALQGDSGYNDYVRSLRQNQENIRKQAKSNEEGLRKKAVEAANARLGEEKDQIKRNITGALGGINQTLDERLGKANQGLQSADLGAYADTQYKSLIDQLLDKNRQDPLLQEAVASGQLIDPTKFASKADPYTNRYLFANPEESMQFNNIMDILGQQDRISSGGYDPAKDFSFNTDAASQELANVAAEKATALGTSYNEELQKLLAGNEAEAAAYQANVASLDPGKIGNDEFQNWWKTLGAEEQGLYGRGGWNIDPSQYVTLNNPGYGADAFMDESEAAKANQIAQKLGLGASYQASNVDLNAPLSSFNKDAFIQAANMHIQQQREAEEQAAAAAQAQAQADAAAAQAKKDAQTTKVGGVKTGITAGDQNKAKEKASDSADTWYKNPYGEGPLPAAPIGTNEGAKKDIDAYLPHGNNPFLGGLSPSKKTPGVKIGGKKYGF